MLMLAVAAHAHGVQSKVLMVPLNVMRIASGSLISMLVATSSSLMCGFVHKLIHQYIWYHSGDQSWLGDM